MKQIEQLDLLDPSNYIAYREGAYFLPDTIDPYTKQALMMIQHKINELVDRVNFLESNRK